LFVINLASWYNSAIKFYLLTIWPNISTWFVPDGFGTGIIVPLIKLQLQVYYPYTELLMSF